MEYLVVILASALAGIGTGLVGLSAATAMVPLLIVLCPTFGGEHGAYMATAIALASDILGSAVTAGVYAKNKKIDLRHGWLFFVCVVGMCTAGSVAAYFTHQAVLGGFSLFLCVAIGIRFLVKPDSKKKEALPAEKKLSAAQIAVSLFFGLTIGFGTGFFGSGGGMMMLIVFTAMLGYDRATAVGTSTFIMTFTALIASVSHIAIEPAIIVEAWDYLLIAIVVATLFSLGSAQFANKVNPRVVGYLTGGILLGLGLVLIALNNREILAAIPHFAEFWQVFGLYVGYIALFAAILLVVRYTTRVPDYIFRKLLHIVAFTSILPLVILTDVWQVAVAVKCAFLVLIIIGLLCIEKMPFYSSLFVEKGKHEVLVSFILLFSLMAILLFLCWGVGGEACKYIAVAAILGWGPGDGAAAIVGKRCGRHKLQGRFIEGVKSVEGSAAMAVVSFVCTLGVLWGMGAYPPGAAIAVSAVVALTAAMVELFTRRGLDTVTVPAAIALLLTAAEALI